MTTITLKCLRLFRIAIVFGTLTTPLSAASYHGHARIGLLNSKVNYLEAIQSEESNDASVISSRFFLEGNKLVTRKDRLVVDVRDKYDSFGVVNPEALSLEAENTLEIRQLVYQKPWDHGSSYYSIGRFSLPQLGIISNDGAEYGMFLSKRHRLGVFVGIAPQDVVQPYSYREDVQGYDGTQGGLYSVYDKRNSLGTKTTYMVNGLAQAPTFELNEFKNRVYFYHQGTFHTSRKHLISSVVDIDIMPSANPRRIYLTHSFLGKSWRTRTSLSRITADDYRVKRDMRDDLEPSPYTGVSFRTIYKSSKSLNWTLKALYGTRSADQLAKNAIEIGPTYRGLMKKRLALGVSYGQRDNYLSNDSFYKLLTRYYRDSYSVAFSYMVESRKYDSGTQLDPTTMSLDIGVFLSKSLRGSFAYINSAAQDRTITSMLMTVGYHFGSNGTSATRRRTARFETL